MEVRCVVLTPAGRGLCRLKPALQAGAPLAGGGLCRLKPARLGDATLFCVPAWCRSRDLNPDTRKEYCALNAARLPFRHFGPRGGRF